MNYHQNLPLKRIFKVVIKTLRKCKCNVQIFSIFVSVIALALPSFMKTSSISCKYIKCCVKQQSHVTVQCTDNR